MLEPMIRGYVIQKTERFFRTECDSSLAQRIDSALPLELKTRLPELSPAGWYPRHYQVALLSAAADAHGSEQLLRRDLMRCGASLAVGDNEFMKLLLKVLTPELFLKKVARLWVRDHKDSANYQLERLDPEARSASLHLRGVAGYTHSALVWQGYLQRIFGAICTHCSVDQQGWSLANPAPDEIVYEVKWS
jgi:hypothetical protein